MKRQILFRGKRLDNNNWIEGFYFEATFCDGKGKQSFIKTDGCSGNAIDAETVGQFIGITDKNGIKIFDDDIVKYVSGICDAVVTGRTLYQWCSCVTTKKREKNISPEVIVIGNIYDNAELLDQ